MNTEMSVKAEKKKVALKKAPDDVYLEHEETIVKLQALWRGYRDRKFVAYLKTSKRGPSKYFTPDESRETVANGRKYDPNAKREERGLYTFKSGATYAG